MISKTVLKQILASNQKDIELYQIVPRELPSDEFERRVFIGVRRAGKSFMLYQKMQQMLAEGHGWEDMLYLNFEDDRLADFKSEDFEMILECHAEMYDKRPMLFLDEVQNIDGWEKFARRLADAKYKVWITGSNAKMLSSEIMTTLGGRFLSTEVYPYSFQEFLKIKEVPYDENSLLATESRAKMLRSWKEFFEWGGLPESVSLSVKRDYLTSTLQMIYLGDIVDRNKISNANLLRLLLKKIAESVKQHISYNRLSNVLSSVSGKITMPTVSKYIEYSEAAWLLLRLRNISSAFANKESLCKYYFIDNGVLHLFLLDSDTALLENLTALTLFRKYGHDKDNERIFFYNDKVEVDFYIPEEKLAIQASYSLTGSDSTYDREVDALKKIPNALECNRRVILTYDEFDTVTDEFGTIEVMPLWNWILKDGFPG
jgi:predicted AAA+ superfamily ATPase